MKIFALLAVVAACSAATFKLPTQKTGSFRAKLIREGKYSAFLAKQHAARIEQLNTGSQPIIDYYDDVYLGNITIGTPAQSVRVLLDTGSSNFYVIDAACNSPACNGFPNSGQKSKKNKFDPSKSSTFLKETRKFSIQYEYGSCSGYLGKDTLMFGGLTVTKQEFGVSTRIDDVFGYQPYDGIFGLGWPALAVDRVVPPLQNALPQLDAPLFTVWLDRKLDYSQGGSGGLITYGAVDTVNCDAAINYVPLTAKNYWQFALDRFAMGTYSYTKQDVVMSDTGTSWLGVPSTVFSEIVKQTGATFNWDWEFYVVDCITMNNQPDLVFTIGGNTYTVPSVEYILDLQLQGGNCALAVFSMGSGGFGPSWVFGDTFIRQYCTIYDIGNARIGFAKAQHSF